MGARRVDLVGDRLTEENAARSLKAAVKLLPSSKPPRRGRHPFRALSESVQRASAVLKNNPRLGGCAALALVVALQVAPVGLARAADATPAETAPKPAEKSAAAEAAKETNGPDEAAAARNAARTRMRECGHQWSSMKKSGAAGGMTWKEFSQGCLARK
jgi:pyruvate/2-oxoglutarate dehydrogenase complex dihydrolipoamide acyltransferase (E2) component